MCSNLKQWLSAGGNPRPRRRRARFDQFRGQFEHLETRTVLSATIGPLPAAAEAPIYSIVIFESHPLEAVAIQANGVWENGGWESGAKEAAEHEQLAPLRIMDSYQQDSPPLALNGGSEAPAKSRRPEQNLPLPGFFQPQNYTHTLIVAIYHLPPTPWAEDVQPQTGTAGSAEPPLSGQSPLPITSDALPTDPTAKHYTNQPANQDWPPLRLIQPPPPVVPYTIESSAAQATAPSSSVARDSVLRDYQSDSLLLTMIGERSTDDDFDLLDDDRLDAGDVSADHLLQLDDADAPDDVALSLDALQRERAAIDAALSELHDMKTADADTAQDAARTADRERLADSGEFDIGVFFADVARAIHSTDDQQNGGMVLLATSGDANASAYDLSTVILSGITDDTIAPLRLDASVGVYQAFDVGGVEQLPAVNAASPAVHGSASVRTSAATENAPAKKSEQPT